MDAAATTIMKPRTPSTPSSASPTGPGHWIADGPRSLDRRRALVIGSPTGPGHWIADGPRSLDRRRALAIGSPTGPGHWIGARRWPGSTRLEPSSTSSPSQHFGRHRNAMVRYPMRNHVYTHVYTCPYTCLYTEGCQHRPTTDMMDTWHPCAAWV